MKKENMLFSVINYASFMLSYISPFIGYDMVKSLWVLGKAGAFRAGNLVSEHRASGEVKVLG